MIASIGPIITILGSVLLVLIKVWQDGQPKRDQEASNDDKEKLRKVIAGVDAAALGAAIDSVPSSTGDSSRFSSDQDIARGIAEITGS